MSFNDVTIPAFFYPSHYKQKWVLCPVFFIIMYPYAMKSQLSTLDIVSNAHHYMYLLYVCNEFRISDELPCNTICVTQHPSYRLCNIHILSQSWHWFTMLSLKNVLLRYAAQWEWLKQGNRIWMKCQVQDQVMLSCYHLVRPHIPHIPHIVHIPHIPHIVHIPHIPHIVYIPHIQVSAIINF